MTKEQTIKIEKLKASGKIENKDFRVVYYGIHAEIKIMYK